MKTFNSLRNCRYCKYRAVHVTSMPCSVCQATFSCPNGSEWEPEEERIAATENRDVEIATSGRFAGPPRNDMRGVDHPGHYNQGKIECIDAMVEAFGKEAVKHFCLLNAFKYVWRSDYKNGTQDIKKAMWYLDKYLELEEQANE